MKKHHRWFIAGMLLCVLLLAACSADTNTVTETNKTKVVENTETPETDEPNRVPDNFTKGYMKADFDAMNSPAEENGLGDTPVYIECKITEITDVGGNFYCFADDTDGNRWLILLNSIILSSIEVYEDLEGQITTLCGFYEGFSEKYKLPAVSLSKLCINSTGKLTTGAAYYKGTELNKTVKDEKNNVVTTDTKKLSEADIISYINDTAAEMGTSFESVSVDETIVYIKIVLPSGTAKNMILQDANTLKLWGSLCDAYDEYAVSLLDVLKKFNRDDLHVCIMLLNDENKENTLYTSLDGVEVYNAAD